MDDTRRCTAHNRAGNRCGRAAIPGGTVCCMHGGKTPIVKAAADRRLEDARQRVLDMLDPATAKLAQLLDSPDENTTLRAVLAVLDRAGLAVVRKSEVDVTHHDGDSELDRQIERLLVDMRKADR